MGKSDDAVSSFLFFCRISILCILWERNIPISVDHVDKKVDNPMR
ncbi:hypothetical protein HMPREF1985_00146 [Mitsuokella sp. oral taxon 131 str. W9106]|nr:hypothetical protein HMPREF1985_00146 [Mitsuokella sp. oral taxon 131 str. W9106]